MVTICDVGPRDGLQSQPQTLAPSVRAELCNRLAAVGLPRVEAVSFVSPERVPQMDGAEEVVASLESGSAVVFAGLVLNERGYERLAAAGLAEAHLTVAVSESFSRENANASVEEAASAAERILVRAREDGIRATMTLSTAFGCPFEGPVDPGRVTALAERLAAGGAAEIVYADTIGVGVPRQVKELLAVSVGVPLGVHLHNTRNTGFANAYAALEAGAAVFDASIGGIGGCPFAPRATGNIATEDLVYLLHGEGVETGIDLGGLIGVSEWLESVLGRELEGQVYRARLS